MFLENFEKYMRERLLNGVKLDRSDEYYILEDNDGKELTLRVISYEGSEDVEGHDFEVFESFLGGEFHPTREFTEYYLTYESSDYHETFDDYPAPYEDAASLGDDDNETFYEWWWYIKDTVREYPFMGNYFDTSKPR